MDRTVRLDPFPVMFSECQAWQFGEGVSTVDNTAWIMMLHEVHPWVSRDDLHYQADHAIEMFDKYAVRCWVRYDWSYFSKYSGRYTLAVFSKCLPDKVAGLAGFVDLTGDQSLRATHHLLKAVGLYRYDYHSNAAALLREDEAPTAVAHDHPASAASDRSSDAIGLSSRSNENTRRSSHLQNLPASARNRPAPTGAHAARRTRSRSPWPHLECRHDLITFSAC